MTLKIWLNGVLLDPDEACVSPFDRGLLLGDGVFETLRSHSGRLPSLREHLERLGEGARVLGIPTPPLEELERGARQIVAAADGGDVRLRITVTSGVGPPGLARGAAAPTVLMTISELSPWPSTATAVVVPWVHDERSPLAGVKTTSRAGSVAALGYARERGADEALFLNSRGNLCEATTANVFAVRGERVVTPPLAAGCLPGITRDQVLRLCDELGIEVAEVDLLPDDARAASELFLTSSTRGVQPLVAVDGVSIGGGEAGPITRRLAEQLAARI